MILRQAFIEEAAKTKKIQIYGIYGELSSIDVISSALDEKYADCQVNIQLIFGPKIKNDNNNKKDLKSLFLNNRGKLFLFQAERRPQSHALVVNDNLIYEDFHPEGVSYDEATVIEGGSEALVSRFIRDFNQLLNDPTTHPLDDEEQIDKIKTYS
ncbi:MAG: hypothetical protein LUQ66_07525 [Methanoregula sp.]|nr:hypothetical protein [Methanoregula sp.]